MASRDEIPVVSIDTVGDQIYTADASNTEKLDEKLFDHPVPANTSMFGSFQILLNTAIGSGTLMVPYCYTSGIIPALTVSIVMGLIAYSSMHFMIDASYYTKRYDYRDLFAHTFGEKYIVVINFMIFMVQFGAAMIYAHWNGRLVNGLINIDHPIFGADTFWTFVVTTLLVFPLTILRSLAKLEGFAMLSTLFIFVLISHALYWFIKGCIDDGFDVNNQFESFRLNKAAITALGVNSMAYNCHINLFPTLYHLRNCTVKRARILSVLVVSIAFVLYNLFGVFSYLYLFDKLLSGKSALEYYDNKNWFTIATKLGVIFVLILSSPLVIWAARNSINNIFFKDPPTSKRWIIIGGSICMLAATIACISDKVVIFFDIIGGLFTPSIIFLMPTLFFLLNHKSAKWFEKSLAIVICIFTAIATVACTYNAIVEIIEAAKE